MNMKDIENIVKIKKETLSSEHYFKSLLEQAYSAGILSDTQLEKIQFDCLALLAKQTNKFNSGDSSSIRIEKAQELLDSIMFTIGVWMKTYSNPDDSLEDLQKNGVSAVYEKGLERTELLIKSAKTLHFSIMRNLLKTDNVFYSSTIVDGIKGFFKLYYPEFAAQEIHITADYPVYHPVEGLLGIEFIRKYLECIYYENLFCTQFPAEHVHNLLSSFDEHYEQLLLNIYEPVLSAAMGCVLSGGDVRKLKMTSSSIMILKDLFSGKDRTAMMEILKGAADKLGVQMILPEHLMNYIYGSLPYIAMSVENAVRLKTMDKVFILPKYPENDIKIIYSPVEKLDDEEYRKVVEEIMQCRYFEDKKALIRSKIRSLEDLEDILLDAELKEEEILSILKELPPAEIAVLVQKHLMLSAEERYDLRESEIVLHDSLKKFMSSFPEKQQDLIKKAAAALDISYV